MTARTCKSNFHEIAHGLAEIATALFWWGVIVAVVLGILSAAIYKARGGFSGASAVTVPVAQAGLLQSATTSVSAGGFLTAGVTVTSVQTSLGSFLVDGVFTGQRGTPLVVAGKAGAYRLCRAPTAGAATVEAGACVYLHHGQNWITRLPAWHRRPASRVDEQAPVPPSTSSAAHY